MNRWRLVIRSLVHHRRINFAVALGVVAATAVLTGALLVGDSVRGSLKDLAITRLGNIDTVIIADRFFAESTAVQLNSQSEFQKTFDAALPMIFLQGTLEHKFKINIKTGQRILPDSAEDQSFNATDETNQKEVTRRAGSVAVLGIESSFWDAGEIIGFDSSELSSDEIVLNQPLAAELDLQVGDVITLRLPTGNDVPPDSPLGRKNDRTKSLPRLTVKAVIEAEGLGRFGLHPSQQLPMNAYMSKSRLQSVLKQKDKVNSVLLTTTQADSSSAVNQELVSQLFQPSLDDFGVKLDRITSQFSATEDATPQVVYDYYQLTSSRMMFNHAAEEALLAALDGQPLVPIYTYLATSIGKGEPPADGKVNEESIPYSTISAVALEELSFPLVNKQGEPIRELADDEIVLNSWAVEKLQAEIGDPIFVTYFNPESAHGVAEESTAVFRLAAIIPLSKPKEMFTSSEPAIYDQLPTTANDNKYTPVVKGITDKDSIDDWDPPFPYDNSRVKEKDEDYWDFYRTTPKAFISIKSGQKLWGSRFGQITSCRLPVAKEITEDALRSQLESAFRERQESIGFRVLPVKYDALRAASGTTPFNILFLGFSFFIIAAALMLVSLLFKLGIEQRASEIGTVLALGVNRKLTANMLVQEGLIVSLLGGLIGTLLGIAYAWLMLAGLRSWWLEAVVTPFLFLKLDNPLTLFIGFFSGSLISLVTIYSAVRHLRKVSLRNLIAGQAEPPATVASASKSRFSKVAIGLFVLSILLAVVATQLSGEAQAGAFFAAGAADLTALLLIIRQSLKLRSSSTSHQRGFSLTQLAASNAARNPGRSTLTIGLMASACFLIIAISSFRSAPSEQGSGGMDLLAESSQPVYHNINSPDGRYDLGFVEADETLMAKSTVLSLRVQPGDDASCLNLYQSNSPRVLGVSPEMIDYYSQADVTSFAWAGSAANTEESTRNPWLVLNQTADGEAEPIPVVLDKNTAMYALHLYGGIGEHFTTTDDDGRDTKYVVAGLLSNSIFQGNLLVAERNFLNRFPDVNGYRMFLVKSPKGESQQLAELLEDRLSNEGFDTISAPRRLTSLLAVQNTYLSTFQSLGALGLLLGTFGLATVQIRSVFQRRGELAVMRASGFRKSQLARMVLWENSLLLLTGLACGAIAALIVVLPHMLIGGASIPFSTLAGMLLVITLVGLSTGLLAVRATLRTPLLASLKNS